MSLRGLRGPKEHGTCFLLSPLEAFRLFLCWGGGGRRSVLEATGWILFTLTSGKGFFNLLLTTCRAARWWANAKQLVCIERGGVGVIEFSLPHGSFPSCVGKSVPPNLIICPLIKTRSRVKRNLQTANSVRGWAAVCSRSPAFELSLSAYPPLR